MEKKILDNGKNSMIKVTPAGKNFIKSIIKENKQLKEQLTEKDEEIERLKQENNKLAFVLAEEPDKNELFELREDLKILTNKTKERDVSIRKQVCNEIREYIKTFKSIKADKYYYPIMQVPLHTFLNHIDQIEQKESL